MPESQQSSYTVVVSPTEFSYLWYLLSHELVLARAAKTLEYADVIARILDRCRAASAAHHVEGTPG